MSLVKTPWKVVNLFYTKQNTLVGSSPNSFLTSNQSMLLPFFLSTLYFLFCIQNFQAHLHALWSAFSSLNLIIINLMKLEVDFYFILCCYLLFVFIWIRYEFLQMSSKLHPQRWKLYLQMHNLGVIWFVFDSVKTWSRAIGQGQIMSNTLSNYFVCQAQLSIFTQWLYKQLSYVLGLRSQWIWIKTPIINSISLFLKIHFFTTERSLRKSKPHY